MSMPMNSPQRPSSLDSSAAQKPSASLWSTAGRRLRRDKLTLAAFAVLGLLVAIALAAPWLSKNFFRTTYEAIDLSLRLKPPSLEQPLWWLGTDEYGRSQLVRLMYGAQVSMGIGLLAALINLSIGITLGLTAGYYRGRLDDFINWLITTFVSIPTIFLLLLVAALFRPNAVSLGLVIGAISWMSVARLVRGQVFAAREQDYVLAARAIGATNRRIMWVHILPNVISIVLIIMGMDIGGVILWESAISYLGFGVQPPMASWGNMLTDAASFIFQAPWLMIAPGFLISLTVLCLYLIGDGLRDALDPRLKE